MSKSRWRYPRVKTQWTAANNQVMSELYALIDHIIAPMLSLSCPMVQPCSSTLVKRDETLPNAIACCKPRLIMLRRAIVIAIEIKWQKVRWTSQTAKQTDDMAVETQKLKYQLQTANWQIDLKYKLVWKNPTICYDGFWTWGDYQTLFGALCHREVENKSGTACRSANKTIFTRHTQHSLLD